MTPCYHYTLFLEVVVKINLKLTCPKLNDFENLGNKGIAAKISLNLTIFYTFTFEKIQTWLVQRRGGGCEIGNRYNRLVDEYNSLCYRIIIYLSASYWRRFQSFQISQLLWEFSVVSFCVIYRHLFSLVPVILNKQNNYYQSL